VRCWPLRHKTFLFSNYRLSQLCPPSSKRANVAPPLSSCRLFSPPLGRSSGVPSPDCSSLSGLFWEWHPYFPFRAIHQLAALHKNPPTQFFPFLWICGDVPEFTGRLATIEPLLFRFAEILLLFTTSPPFSFPRSTSFLPMISPSEWTLSPPRLALSLSRSFRALSAPLLFRSEEPFDAFGSPVFFEPRTPSSISPLEFWQIISPLTPNPTLCEPQLGSRRRLSVFSLLFFPSNCTCHVSFFKSIEPVCLSKR